MSKLSRARQSGFTLMELLVVIAIIAERVDHYRLSLKSTGIDRCSR